MGVFVKRPLCLFCFCFIGAALVASRIEGRYKLIAFVPLFVCALFLFVVSRCVQKRRYGFVEGFIALLFACVAVLQSFLTIDLPAKKLERLEAKGAPVEFVVVREESSSRFYTKYYGKLATVDGSKVNERAYLVLDYESDYSAGERLLLVGDIVLVDNGSSALASQRELEITSVIDKDLILTDSYTGFDVSILCGRLSEYVRGVLLGRLDFSSAALSFGFLTGNTSMIESEVIRDFRRTGLSHLLAVSGLHLSVILGGIELVLKKLCISKGKRCIAISFLSFAFLALAGFSVSACRSVLMLLCAYLCYALSKESDTLTSLAVAGAFILFVSPNSVFSVSFWLSFLATLGIVLYGELLLVTHLERKLRKAGVPGALRSIISKISGALLVALSANVFICIVFYIVFGEMSVVFPASNLVVTPLGEVYLILTVLVFLLGGIPFVGEALSFVTLLLSELMTNLAGFFSRFDFSVVSLEYSFAPIIIYLATVVLAVLFIVKLRKRMVTVLPPIVATVLFCVSFTAYGIFNDSARVIYTNINDRDNVVVSDSGKAVMIDISDGTYSSFYFACRNAHENAITELEAVVLTHYHERYVSSIDRLLGTEMVRSIYLPLPQDVQELQIMNDLVLCAKDHGVTLKTYKKEQELEISDFSFYLFEKDEREGSTKSIISFSLQTDDGLLSYADASWHLGDAASKATHFISHSDALILGSHGPFPTCLADGDRVEYPPVVVGADIEIFAVSPNMPVADSRLIIGTDYNGALVAEFDFKDR